MRTEKYCSRCDRTLPVAEFYQHRNRLSAYCKGCQKGYQKQYYQGNREKMIKQVADSRRQRKKEIKALIDEFRVRCVACGEDEKVCLDFHHINSEEKEISISEIWTWNDRERIIAEIEKCVCLCSNCHRKLHAGLIDLNGERS